jgi:hypothetical protein
MDMAFASRRSFGLVEFIVLSPVNSAGVADYKWRAALGHHRRHANPAMLIGRGLGSMT